MADPTDADLNSAARAALLRALQTGKQVTFGNRSVTSHELEDLVTLMTRSEALLSGGGAPLTRVAAYCSGL